MSTEKPEIEEVIPLDAVRDYEYSRPRPSDDRLDDRVRVVVTPSLYMVEFGLSPPGKTELTVLRYYGPEEARQLATQLRSGDAERLIERLGAERAQVLADDLDAAASVAGTKAIGEVVGDDVIRSFKEGKVTADEFAHEYSRGVDRTLAERDESDK
jgi:hypothetical protein